MNAENTIITSPISSEDVEHLDTIELLFFAYRDFVGDPDRILSKYNFGRAHHRTLYFVNRNPGMTVAELLTILNITKQSLSRVLRELIDSDYIMQATGKNDRRKRLLYPTSKGRELVLALSLPQSERIRKAFETLDTSDRLAVTGFLKSMLGQPEPEQADTDSEKHL